jgi:tetratricopeptide (TPR) repeat protein
MHLEKAIAAEPDKYSLHFTFGRWCMEVAKLSWMERKIASTLFEKVPEATYEDAVKHFETCEKLKPDWKAAQYWKARSFIQLKKYPEAIKSLDLADSLAPQDSEDQVIESDLKTLVGKYASYR